MIDDMTSNQTIETRNKISEIINTTQNQTFELVVPKNQSQNKNFFNNQSANYIYSNIQIQTSQKNKEKPSAEQGGRKPNALRKQYISSTK